MPPDTELISRASRSSPRTDLICRHGASSGRLDLGCAEFVFRDLAERVELRVGQDIGRRLGIAERDKHLARGYGAVAARLQFDASPSGGDTHSLARSDA